MSLKEEQICNNLVDKYPNLISYKTKSWRGRFKVQKKNITEILKIITDDNDKEKFNEFLSLYNSRKGKTNIEEKNKDKKEKDKIHQNNSDNSTTDNFDDSISDNSDDSIEDNFDDSIEDNLDDSIPNNFTSNNIDNPFKKQRDNVLKKLSQLQNDYDELEEKYDNLNNIHNEFKVSYKEACHERNKLELLTEKKGWTKDIREEFNKYKSFYQKYIECVDELDKIKN